jgi:MoxR-like ATPase
MVDLREIADLEKFKTQAWTEDLSAMGLKELRKLYEDHHNLVEKCLGRVKEVCRHLKSIFVGKDELIDFMAIATIAQLPLLMLGTWGTGKSLLVRKFAEGLGIYPAKQPIAREEELLQELLPKVSGDSRASTADILAKFAGERRHFEYLVTRFTTPEELLGGVHIDIMLNRSVFLRNTRGLMPRAEIVFLDEVFKSNSAVLNALLSIMNERLFYNAGIPWLVNMIMLFGASNEPPQEAELGAFYDRFPVRAMCDPVPDNEKTVRMLLDCAHTQSFASLIPSTQDPRKEVSDVYGGGFDARFMPRCACVNDFRLLHKMSLIGFGGIEVTDSDSVTAKEFTNKFITVFTDLRHTYDVSDRSCGHFYRLARARALFYGRRALAPEDCKVFYYCAKDPVAARKLPAIVDALLG